MDTDVNRMSLKVPCSKQKASNRLTLLHAQEKTKGFYLSHFIFSSQAFCYWLFRSSQHYNELVI